MMNELPRQKLCELIKRYDASLCHHPLRLEGLLRDFCGEYRKEIAVLINAVKEGIPTDLLGSQNTVPIKILLARLTKRLQNNLGLADDAARWGVESWALALGIVSSAELETLSQSSQSQHQESIQNDPPAQYQQTIIDIPTNPQQNTYPQQTSVTSQPLNRLNTLPNSIVAVEYASIWTRLGAFLIDFLIVSVVVTLISSYFDGLRFIFFLLLSWLYSAFMESSQKQATFGKIALGIIVTDLNGNKITFGRATGRYIGKIVSVLIFGIGFLLATFTDKKQALHDNMARCIVVLK
jgi:uncharacterized RDD family membrane protein YckC